MTADRTRAAGPVGSNKTPRSAGTTFCVVPIYPAREQPLWQPTTARALPEG
jgi:hypothetical protein